MEKIIEDIKALAETLERTTQQSDEFIQKYFKQSKKQAITNLSKMISDKVAEMNTL